jgi:hypothetical protein
MSLDLRTLIAAVEARNETSRRLECEVALALGIFAEVTDPSTGVTVFIEHKCLGRPASESYPPARGTERVPAWTRSIDALKALLEDQLPGWLADVELGALAPGDKRYRGAVTNPKTGEACEGYGNTPELAFLAAILQGILWRQLDKEGTA